LGGGRASEVTNEREKGVSEFESVSCDLRLRVRAANVYELRSTVLRAELSKVRSSLLALSSLSAFCVIFVSSCTSILVCSVLLYADADGASRQSARQPQSSARGECAALFLEVEVHFGGKTSHRMNHV
jgi:hypothetical protein